MRSNVLVALILAIGLKLTVRCSESDPLILTPLLEAGKYQEAQQKSMVVPDIQGVKSYTGYFTVNKECGNNLFFWFTPAEKNWESAPVLLWLNGGPGCTSLFGMFEEIGPFNYVMKKGLVKRKYHWSLDNNIIYLDQPAGTGFSFTSKNCYAKNLTTVAQEAYESVVQFFMLFPNLQKPSFFILGESYSGHYIPAIAYEIDRENANAKIKINLLGIMVGNPFIDQRCQNDAAYMYQLGIIDEKSRDLLEKLNVAINSEIDKGDYKKALEVGLASSKKIPPYVTVPPVSYNILYDKSVPDGFVLFVRKYETRKLIHVGQTPFKTCSDEVNVALELDNFIPAGHYIEQLLQTKKYTVGFYSGHLDVVCVYTAVPCVLRQLKWSGAGDYLVANRTKWYVGDRLAGWYKTAGNLFEVVVKNSGHFVPTDQPEAALDLLKAFVADRPGTKLLTKLQTESIKSK